MKIPFIGGSYKGRSSNLNAQQTINLFPVIDNKGGKSEFALFGTPGTSEYLDIGTEEVIRGIYTMGDYLYVVLGDTLYQVDDTPSATSKGTLNSTTGTVYMEDNGTQLMIADGSDGYTYTPGTDTFAEIADADFPGSVSVAVLDGYFIVNKPNTYEIYISALLDGTSWDALDFASAEGRLDNTVRVMAHNRMLWIFGSQTVEIWYNSGAADYPFERYPGGFIEKGCIAPASAAAMDGTVYWLSNDGMVLRANGFQPEAVSTRQIEYQFHTYSTLTDAVAYTYVEEGHSFYVLTFPTADKTWVYDSSTGEWHQRSTGVAGGRHRGNCYARYDNKHIIGDYTDGKLYVMDMDTYQDDGDEIKRVRVAQAGHNERKNLIIDSLELEFESGVGIDPGYDAWATGTTYADNDIVFYDLDIYQSQQGSNTGHNPASDDGTWWVKLLQEGNDPQAILDWSDDGGHTWSNEHWTSIGKMGQYTRRAIWRRLGITRNRNFRVTISDPVKVIIIDGYVMARAASR